MLLCMLGTVAFGTIASALTTDATSKPYQGIVDRNVFGLKPAPPPPDPTEVNKPPPVKITLTGITTILGNKRVLMKAPSPAAKPGEQPKGDRSYILTEGQMEDDIEVLEINEKTGDVKLKNAGAVVTLNLMKDGPKPPMGAAPAPGVPGAPGGAIPGLPGVAPAAGQGNPAFPLPARIPRVPGATGTPTVPGSYTPTALPGAAPSASYTSRGATPVAYNSGQTGGYVNNTPVGSVAGTPSANLPVGSLTQPPQNPGMFKNWPPERTLSPDEEALMNAVQQQADPNLPPVPGAGGATIPPNQIQNPAPNQPTSPFPVPPGMPRGF
jgi:hypothetical protein